MINANIAILYSYAVKTVVEFMRCEIQHREKNRIREERERLVKELKLRKGECCDFERGRGFMSSG